MNKDGHQKDDLNLVIDQAIKLSSDSFINKLMTYLSKLPIEYSYKALVPFYYDLLEYKSFMLHLEKWFT